MNPLLQNLVSKLIKFGNLKVTGVNGTTRTYGDGQGSLVHLAVRRKGAEMAIALDPELALPEAYMDGDLDIVEGNLLDLLKIIFMNGGGAGEATLWTKTIDQIRQGLKRLQQINSPTRSRENVHRHYDLSGELYRLFLDPDLQYSCAYFETPDETLDEAQLAKKRHIAAKLEIKPGQRILDIGCGWGGFGLYLAKHFGADVTGVTLSEEQYAVAKTRAREAGLEDRAHFELMDYRNVEGPFDRIVSVGMFEHVGLNHFATFFDKCASLLKEDGVMLLHTIGRTGKPVSTSPFIRKHIFPGGYIPALSEVMPTIERTSLGITDVEILRLHYAETLKNWRERFQAHREEAKAIYDERFCRMWEFYLAGSEASFRWGELVNFQIQLSKKNDAVPMTRDYIAAAETELKKLEKLPTNPRAGDKFHEAAE